jgi:hypothetical protein
MHCKLRFCYSVQTHPNTDFARYFVFQAALIVCLCLRSQQGSPQSVEWREQIEAALAIMDSLGAYTHASKTCHEVLERLCEGRLRYNDQVANEATSSANPYALPMDENFSMVWPDVYPIEDFDESTIMQADFWTDLLPEGM